jgi:Ca2+-binding EF-hand superfamily protein
MNRICFAALLAIVTAAASVRAEEKAPAAAPDFPKRVNMGAEALKQFDKDGDGKLSEDERKAMMEARKAMGDKMRLAHEKEFDKNGDGKLDDAEKAAMMEARKTMREQFMQAREKEFDKNGDGKLDDAERATMMESFKQRNPEAAGRMQEMVKRFDKDGDGKLNDDERKALRDERVKHMQQRGANPPAGGAPARVPAAK